MLRLSFAIAFFILTSVLAPIPVSAQELPAAAQMEAQVAPERPVDVEAVATSQSQIVLTWSIQRGQVAGFVVERSNDGSTFQQVASLPADATSFTDTSLPA